jgi:hypothetical protein
MPKPPAANEEWVMTIAIPGALSADALKSFKDACNALIEKHKGRVLEVKLQPKKT